MRFSRMIFGCVLFLTAVLPPLSGCTTNPATGAEDFTAFMSPEQELKIGAKEHPKLVREFGGEYPDKTLDAYINRIGQNLARVSERSDLKFTFTVLNDDRINAFALPGGYVHITRGLLALAENESEVAGVLGHEIGHVVARHTAQRYSRAVMTNFGLTLLGVLGQVAGAPVGVGDLASAGANLYLKAFSRSQETEADTLGIRYMTRAGYSVDGMITFFRKLKGWEDLEAKLSNQKTAQGSNFNATHPRTVDRIKHAMELARINHHPDAKVNREVYIDHLDGLLFGDDPSQGIRRGRLFQHPGLRIQFKVPPAFAMFNQPTQVVARGPDDATIAYDMLSAKEVRDLGRLTDYLADHYGVHDIQKITVNGMNAATGEKRITAGGKERDGRIVLIEESPDRIHRLVFLTPPNVTAKYETAFRRTTYSFRKLTAAEADAIRPLRIRLKEVRRGDTVATLAAGQPFARGSEDWFRLLNQLAIEHGLKPGMLVKTVSE